MDLLRPHVRAQQQVRLLGASVFATDPLMTYFTLLICRLNFAKIPFLFPVLLRKSSQTLMVVQHL